MSKRVVIAGAGALGSVYGGLLAESGADVVLVARGAHGEAMERRGLRLVLPDRELRVRVAVAASAEGDAVLVTGKAFDSAGVLAAVAGAPGLAISLQNGPRKNEPLAARFGADAVAGATSMVAAELAEPGVVRVSSLGGTHLAPRVAGQHGPVECLATQLRTAGLTVHVVEDADGIEWSKLAHVAALMGVQAVARVFLHELLVSPDGAALVRDIIAEVGALARATGAGIGDWPGMLPVRTLAEGSEEAGVALLGERGRLMAEAGAVWTRTSLVQSLEAGRPTELEAIHGELVRLGERVGVPAPTLESVYRLARLVSSRASAGASSSSAPITRSGGGAKA